MSSAPIRAGLMTLVLVAACSGTSDPTLPPLQPPDIETSTTTPTTPLPIPTTTAAPAIDDPFIDVVISSLPWDHDEWTVGSADIPPERDHGFIDIYRDGSRVMQLELLGDCLNAASAIQPPEESEIVKVWGQQAAAHRGDFEVDEFALEVDSVLVGGTEVRASLWSHFTERGLVQAEIRAYFDGEPAWCQLAGPGVHPEDLEAVLDFYPVLLAFLRQAGEPNPFDAEAMLQEIRDLRAEAGPGHLVGFLYLSGETSTGPPKAPLENPICRGTVEGNTDHLAPGRPVEVFGSGDALIAQTFLWGALFDDTRGCTLWFGVDVPETDWFSVKLGLHSGADFDANQVARGGWIVHLWSDQSALEESCGNNTDFPTCAVIGFGG